MQAAHNTLRQRITSQSCLACGGAGASLVKLERFWSFLLFSMTTPVEDYLCPACGTRKVRAELWRTALFGWWGMPWGALTPIHLGRQLLTLSRTSGSVFKAFCHLPIALFVPLLVLASYHGLVRYAGSASSVDSLKQGRFYFERGEYARSIPFLRQALAARPSVQARYMLARSLSATGAPEEAATELVEVLKLDPDYRTARLALAEIRYRLGQLRRAAPLLAALLDKKLDRRVLLLAVRVQSELGNGDQAWVLLGRGLTQWPNNSQLLRKRGDLHYRHGRVHKALADYRAAWRASPDSLDLRLDYLRLAGLLGGRRELLAQLDTTDATRLFRAQLLTDPRARLAVLLRKPRTPRLQLAAARWLAGLGRYEKAQRQLDESGLLVEEVQTAAPQQQTKALLLQARLLARQGKAGAPELEKAARKGVPRLTLDLERARLYRLREQWGAAEKIYAKLLMRHPESVLTRSRVLRLWAGLGRERGGASLVKAAQLLDKAQDGLPPGHQEVARGMRDAGMVAMEAGQLAEAHKHFTRALRTQIPFVEVLQAVVLYRGLCDLLLDRPEAGRSGFKRLAKYPLERSTANPFPVLAARFLLGRISEKQLIDTCRRLGPVVLNNLSLVRAARARQQGNRIGAQKALRAGIGGSRGRDFPYHLLRWLVRR